MKLQRIILIVAGVMVIVGGFHFTNLGENLVKIIYQQLFIYRSSRTPINFYGKVIDENGKPVPWAEVKVSISNPGHRIYGKDEELRSDAKGDFQILGKRGYSISIYVDSADHHKTESAHQTFDYVFVGRSQPPFPTEYKPAIFVLKRRGMPAVLDGVYDKKIMLPLDGQPAIINLANGNETLGPNSIVFTLISDSKRMPRNGYHPYDWTLTITVPNGGIQERKDILQFIAPSSGYLPAFMYDGKYIGRARWKPQVQTDFFIKFSDGRFGRFSIDASSGSGQTFIDSYVNSAVGDPNLESNRAVK